MKPIFASAIVASPLIAALVYILFFIADTNSQPSHSEASGSFALSIILAFLIGLVFIVYPFVKNRAKSSLAFFIAIIFCISILIGAFTVLIMFGFKEFYLPTVGALMLALPSVPISALWWWLVSMHNPSFKRDWLKPAP
ncbi:hypothetical protein Meth11DRAFT_1565 [Methylophilaceae bacterium 11]|nr:hypothetical protein Meth11DRAFT_1565 [Methylophilaceae bacterium 11]